ncbi:hypothetical protein DFP72DRAFT_862765 [Ephemerocybe angulata]|uniref:Uncharacterized protein n=1 Tax=Ephemerocybe angulata TaxID=980116 RepID=A0A8H6LSP5_9AGAR|nr:hypothetical protein DFP72DRAFT_862765 [Tulosesus angulatus]
MEAQEIIDMVIDGVAEHQETAKPDLLNLALVASSWVNRSRYNLFRLGYAKVNIDSAQKARIFAMLLENANSTIKKAELSDATLYFGQSLRDKQNILTFLQNSVVTNTLSLTLAAPTGSRGTPQNQFPWLAISSWSSLTRLKIVASLPSVQTFANIITALPKLHTLTSNVHFVDLSVPPLCIGTPLPAIQNLHIGPRGYALLGWLALSNQAGYPLQDLVLDVGSEDPSPLQDFALANANGVDHVRVTLQDCRWARRVSRGMALLDVVFGVDIVFQYPDYTATEDIVHTLEILAQGLTSSTLMDIEISLPRLRSGLRDQLTVLRALEAFVAEFSPVTPDALSLSVSERRMGSELTLIGPALY